MARIRSVNTEKQTGMQRLACRSLWLAITAPSLWRALFLITGAHPQLPVMPRTRARRPVAGQSSRRGKQHREEGCGAAPRPANSMDNCVA